jgi:predicted transcriptional regulator
VYTQHVAAHRINVSLDPEYSEKLSRLAERMHVQEGTLAKSLLSSALDGADPDADHIVELLNAIPGAYERAQEGIAQARRGEGVPLDELA